MRRLKNLFLVVWVIILLGIGVYALSFSDFINAKNFHPRNLGRNVPMLSPSNCDPNQTIMTINLEQNSHVGLWDAGYPIKVCYPDIFGSNYVPRGQNVHACNSVNRVIKLNDIYNAHAASNSDQNAGFNESVCYGDLSCQTSTTECSGNYKLVVSLSSENNAHAAPNNSYSLKVCCTNVAPQDVTPSLTIIKPEKSSNYLEWQKFAVNQTVSFEQISYAIVDWNVRWGFGGGVIPARNMPDCQTSNCNTTEVYQEQAHYTISAYAKEQTGLNRTSLTDYSDILVYKPGINIFAIISEPGFNQTISGGSTVKVNGKNSFVANCTQDSSTIPGTITYYSVGTGNSTIYCYNFAKPPKPGESGTASYKLWYEWIFDFGKPYESRINGTWNDNYDQIVEFNKTFVEEGQHFASLTVTYESI